MTLTEVAMPNYKVGQMFKVLDEPVLQYVFVTTNAVLKQDGSLVMGAGAAGHAAKRWPGLDKLFGHFVAVYGSKYGLILPLATRGFEGSAMLSKKFFGRSSIPDYWLVGALQTKMHYRSNSTLDLVGNSISKLRGFAHMRDIPIHINYPGVGLGGLRVADVHPLLETLPDNVTVWSLKELR
jgi:hypothetical protein